MRVKSQGDHKEMPEECDGCGSMVKLERFESFGPGFDVSWLCNYCTCDFTRGDSAITKSIAAMFNILEEQIKNLSR